ncbi:MAG: Gfo/Idh/MocA family oxidoreductase [Pseudomonadota bacterium]
MSLPRIAVVGAGLIGRKHANLLAAAGQLAALVDPDPAVATIAESLGAPWFADLERGLSGVDGAIIATPNPLHAAHGRACVARGVPILIEKPITDRVESARALVSAAAAAGTPILVGHHRRHNPLVARAKAAIHDGLLGAITVVNAHFWLHKPDEYFASAWRRSPGAGPIFLNLIHDIDLLRHLCGEIVEVSARQSSARRGFGVEDTAVILLTFDNGALGTVSLSDTVVAPWSWEFASGENPAYPKTDVSAIQIAGTMGALSLPDLALWSQPEGRSWWKPIARETLAHTPADPLARQIAHFNAVIGGAAPLVSGRDGAHTLAVVEAIKQSAERGRAVSPETL